MESRGRSRSEVEVAYSMTARIELGGVARSLQLEPNIHTNEVHYCTMPYLTYFSLQFKVFNVVSGPSSVIGFGLW